MFPFYCYFVIFTVPVFCLAAIGSGPAGVALALALAFAVHPAAEFAMRAWGGKPLARLQESAEPTRLYRLPVYLCLPVQLLLVAKAFAYGSSDLAHAIVSGTLCGISGGIIGIAAGHELSHSKRAWERKYGKALLYAINYPHFHLEHLWHHLKVASLDDPDTARRGESFYRFFVRSVPSGWLACWRWQNTRRKMLVLTVTQLSLIALVWVFGGPFMVVAFMLQGLVTLSLLKLINYVEHYGLERKTVGGRLEPVNDHHSWDSTNPLTNWSLFNLGFHTQHHKTAHVTYDELPAKKEEWINLPHGYPSMMMLALVPPLWEDLLHPLLDMKNFARDGGAYARVS